MSKTLADFTDPRFLLTQLEGADVREVIHELATTLHRGGSGVNVATMVHVALEREGASPTATNSGIALPHARLADADRIHFALGLKSVPIRWGRTGRPVRLVFLTALPVADAQDYLQLISGFARLSRDSGLLRSLLEASDGHELYRVIGRVSLWTGPARSVVWPGQSSGGRRRGGTSSSSPQSRLFFPRTGKSP